MVAVPKWERIFAHLMATAAAIDQMVHHSVILEFDVPSRHCAATGRGRGDEPAKLFDAKPANRLDATPPITHMRIQAGVSGGLFGWNINPPGPASTWPRDAGCSLGIALVAYNPQKGGWICWDFPPPCPAMLCRCHRNS